MGGRIAKRDSPPSFGYTHDCIPLIQQESTRFRDPNRGVFKSLNFIPIAELRLEEIVDRIKESASLNDLVELESTALYFGPQDKAFLSAIVEQTREALTNPANGQAN